jgi:hypothetical protein
VQEGRLWNKNGMSDLTSDRFDLEVGSRYIRENLKEYQKLKR